MPGSPSFNNTIIKRNVSLAITQILAAPSTQTWTPTRVSISNTLMPTGFRHLGAVVEDQVALTISKEVYQLALGIPRVLQYSAVVGVSGRLEAQFHSFNLRTMGYALGNVDPVNTVRTIYQTSLASGAWGLSDYTTIAANTPGFGGILVGDVIVASSSSPGLLTTDNEAEVNSIGTGANTMVLYFTSPGFLTKPETNWFFGKLSSVAVPAGTSKIKEYHFIGIADTIDGYQLIHDIQKARVAAGDMQDAMRPTENGRVQGRWDLYGYLTTRFGGSELVVAEKFWFPLDQ